MAAAGRSPGNPASLHGSGRRARRELEECRERIAATLRVRPSELIVTSGGTESDNIGLIGAYRRRSREDPRRRRLLISAVEHSAIRDAAIALERDEGALITWIPCDSGGVVHAGAVRAAIEEPASGGPGTVAVAAVMAVNNEVGTIQPISQIAEVTAESGVPLHVDAVQAVGVAPVPAGHEGVTTLAISGHKFGAPPGTGLLMARRNAPLEPLGYGGGQERGLRPGTIAHILVAGLDAALTCAEQERAVTVPRLAALRDRLITGVLGAIPGAQVTGVWHPGDTATRSAANVHVLLPECEGDALLYLLDAAGVECSTGSACHAGIPQPSHVVMAMGYDETVARGALRLSLGHTSTAADVDQALAALPGAVDRAQRAYRVTRPAGGERPVGEAADGPGAGAAVTGPDTRLDRTSA